jgi:hypothetical protein
MFGVMTRSSTRTPRGMLTLPLGARRALAAIEAVVGLNAIGGMAYALGGAKDVPPEWLDGTPFGSYAVPGLYLGVVVGGSCLAGAYTAARDDPRARATALASSAAMVSWIAAQAPMIGYRSPLQPIICGHRPGRRLPRRTAVAMGASVEISPPPDLPERLIGRTAVDLYWLPLGAGGSSVRVNGRIFAAVAARLGHRAPCDLYHSALEVRAADARYVIEMAPVWNERASDRGVVGEGAVGSRLLGGLRVFRYEIRCWRDGRIPDVAEAVDSPQRLTEDPLIARRVLELVRKVPTHVWGRDELGTGGMWNSNSLIAWLLVGGVIDPRLVRLPACGRAPGWDAGLALARRAVARAVAA